MFVGLWFEQNDEVEPTMVTFSPKTRTIGINTSLMGETGYVVRNPQPLFVDWKNSHFPNHSFWSATK